MPQIDRRPDARIVRSALDEVKAIQTLLSDVYKDLGDGRTPGQHDHDPDDAPIRRTRQ